MNEELKKVLLGIGLTEEQVGKLETEGVNTGEDLALLNADEIRAIAKCGLICAKKIAKQFAPVSETQTTVTVNQPVSEIIPEGVAPSPAQVNNFANQMGIDPNTLSMIMFANMGSSAGMDMDLSSMLPIGQIISGYNPKIRNMPYMIAGQIEKRLGVPIIVINDDGSINADLSVKYVMSLEEGFEAATDNIYYDESGSSYEVIRVGVDAQSIYDSDPLDSAKALQKNGMGIGRINWHNVPLDVRQIVFFAVKSGELSSTDESKLSWLRSNIKTTTTKATLRPEFPKALMEYNEAYRTGTLPTLRTQLSRTARKNETMPRRRVKEDRPEGGNTFRNE